MRQIRRFRRLLRHIRYWLRITRNSRKIFALHDEFDELHNATNEMLSDYVKWKPYIWAFISRMKEINREVHVLMYGKR